MRYAVPLIALLVLLFPAPALAYDSACPVWKAERDVRAARRAVNRAERRLAEAKRVLAATRSYTETYGSGVGRWVRCAREEGYPWCEFPVLMRVIDRESCGDPSVPNLSGSPALGLMQVMPEWANGSKAWYWDQYGLSSLWDRTNPRVTLRHTVHMDWSNWGESL